MQEENVFVILHTHMLHIDVHINQVKYNEKCNQSGENNEGINGEINIFRSYIHRL